MSLHHDVRTSDATVLREHSDLVHFGDELKDFSDTGAPISNLDRCNSCRVTPQFERASA
jgi:hypothetical protein